MRLLTSRHLALALLWVGTGVTSVSVLAAPQRYRTTHLEIEASVGEGWLLQVFEKQDRFRLRYASKDLLMKEALQGNATVDDIFILSLPVPNAKFPGTQEEIAEKVVREDVFELHDQLFGERKRFRGSKPFLKAVAGRNVFEYEFDNPILKSRLPELFGRIYLYFPPDFESSRRLIWLSGIENKRDSRELPENLDVLDHLLKTLKILEPAARPSPP